MEKIGIKEKIENIQKSSSPLDILPKYLPDVFKNNYFFISYCHDDYKEVYEDLLMLQENGIQLWYDRDMPAGKDWQEIAAKYMYPFSCKGVIFYLSKNSVISDATIKELKYAKQINKPIIVIHISDEKNQALHEMIDYLTDENRKNDYYDILPKTVIYLPISMPAELRAEKIKGNLHEIPKLVVNNDYIEDIDSYAADIIKSADANVISITKSDILNSFNLKEYRKKDGKDFFVETLIIRRFAFANNELLRTFDVSFSDQVYQVAIKEYAFADCTSLTNFITSPEWIPFCLIISKGAFVNCHQLKSLNCGFTLENDGSPEAFKNCESIEEVIVKGNGPIGQNAFSNCRSLKRIELRGRILNIERGAFESCTSLESLYIPNNVVLLENHAFAYCTSLKEISLPDTVVCARRNHPFTGCTALSKIIFRGKKKDFLSNEGLIKEIANNCPLVREVICDDCVVPIRLIN